MTFHSPLVFTALALLAGTAMTWSAPMRAQPANTISSSTAAAVQIRPEFTRPGGTPGAARATGAPERFWDGAQSKKNKKNIRKNSTSD